MRFGQRADSFVFGLYASANHPVACNKFPQAKSFAPPPQPNPKDVASAEKDKAQAANYAAQAQGQELENQEAAFRMGAHSRR